MANPETVIQNKILARHGSRPNTRLWRNETAGAWVGKYMGRTTDNAVVIAQATHIQAGLAVGSPDIIGIHEGRFVAIEVKLPGKNPTKQQKAFLDTVRQMGGIAGVARSTEDSDRLLGEPEGEG